MGPARCVAVEHSQRHRRGRSAACRKSVSRSACAGPPGVFALLQSAEVTADIDTMAWRSGVLISVVVVGAGYRGTMKASETQR